MQQEEYPSIRLSNEILLHLVRDGAQMVRIEENTEGGFVWADENQVIKMPDRELSLLIARFQLMAQLDFANSQPQKGTFPATMHGSHYLIQVETSRHKAARIVLTCESASSQN